MFSINMISLFYMIYFLIDVLHVQSACPHDCSGNGWCTEENTCTCDDTHTHADCSGCKFCDSTIFIVPSE